MNKPRRIPQRMCVGCREMKGKRELIRIVRTPAGEIEIDPGGKKAGRGAYICPAPDCLTRAIKGNRLQKALESDIPADIVEKLSQQITDMV